MELERFYTVLFDETICYKEIYSMSMEEIHSYETLSQEPNKSDESVLNMNNHEWQAKVLRILVSDRKAIEDSIVLLKEEIANLVSNYMAE